VSKNATGGLPQPTAADHYLSQTPIGGGWSLQGEIERESWLGVSPSASPLWLLAPPGLRRRYADGQATTDEFWRALRQWIRFEELSR
jgi:hypothetical protein